MERKAVPLPAVIAVIVVVVGLLCVYGYRQMSPPGYVTTKETGVPAWVTQWEKDHKNGKAPSGPITSSGPATNAPPAASGQ